jgi:16S rRNA (guanine527-N7)-methyltransferase
MESLEPWNALQEAASSLFSVTLDAARIETLQTLYTLLLEANKTMNLTRITAIDDFWRLHLLDSYSVVPKLQGLPPDFQLLDLGSGAGFPALPLAILFPEARIVAVESVQKKARFITETAQALGLGNVTVLAERSEDLGQDPRYRGKYDVVTARAVAALNILVEISLPFLKQGGVLVAMKSESALPTESHAAKHALSELGGVLESTVKVYTPFLPNHALAVVRKQKPTPSKYPRKPGIPAKSPL